MADTLQCVHWTLEHACPLRTGRAISDPVAALSAVHVAQRYVDFLKNPKKEFGIFGDVYVNSISNIGNLPKRLHTVFKTPPPSFIEGLLLGAYKPSIIRSCSLPAGGHIISEEFKNIGGPNGIQAMCENCPVNATRPTAAGCSGYLGGDPDSEELQSRFASNIARLGLESQIARHFLVTNPIWYGLWAKSPLSPQAAGLLIQIMTPVDHPHTNPADWIGNPTLAPGPILVAAHIAHTTSAKLHVRMAPPGHTDFGYLTIFAHCPLCKAKPHLFEWDPKKLPPSYKCQICSTTYSPADQASHERMIDHDALDSLKERLGPDRYKQLLFDYLQAQGRSHQDALDIIEATRQAELDQLEFGNSANLSPDAPVYLRESLYAGLKLHPIHSDSTPQTVIGHGLRADDFHTLLQRCANRRITVVGMNHTAHGSPEFERYVFHATGCLPFTTKSFNPLRTYQTWRSQGCDGLFQADVNIPDSVLQAFLKTHANISDRPK